MCVFVCVITIQFSLKIFAVSFFSQILNSEQATLQKNIYKFLTVYRMAQNKLDYLLLLSKFCISAQYRLQRLGC